VNLFSTFTQFLFGFQTDAVNTFLLSLWPILIIVAILALRKVRRALPESEYFALAFIVPVFVAFAASFVVTPLYVSRYLIFTLPALFLLVSSIISLYPPTAAQIARGALIVLMLGALTFEIVNPAVPVKENYVSAVNYLEANAAPQDVIVLSAPFTLYPFEYYYRGPATIATIPTWNPYAHGAIPAFTPAELDTDVKAATAYHQQVWLLLSYDQGYAEDVRIYFDTHYKRTLVKSFSPGLDLYAYQLRYDTPLTKR
jgi:mannosyltransferase